MSQPIYERVLALAAVAILAIGCGANATAPSTGSEPSVSGNKEGGEGQNRLTLTIVTGESSAEESRAFAAAVADLSEGLVEVKVDNTTIHDSANYESDVIRYVADGKAELGFATASAFDTVGVDAFEGLVAPFLIDSHELEDAVLSSDWGKALLDETRAAGVVGVGYFQGPMRRPLGMTRDLVELADYAGAKVGIRASSVKEMTMRALGATPVVFAPSDTTGLDGMEVNMGLLVGTKYDVGASSLTGNVMFWPRPGVIFVNEAVFDGLTPEQQSILRSAGDRMYSGSVESIVTNGPPSIATLCGRGLSMVAAPGSAIADLRAAVQPVYDELRKDAATKATIERIEALKAAGGNPPVNVECPEIAEPVHSAAPPVTATPLIGTFATTFTEAELAASPWLYELDEVNLENWGDFTITFDETGRVTVTQANAAEQSSTSGTYAVDGEVVTMAYDQGANFGETFTARWSVFRDALTFERIGDQELPTPYVVKTWTRVP